MNHTVSSAPQFLDSHDGLGGEDPLGTAEVMGSERTTTKFKATQRAFPCNAEASHGEQRPDFEILKAFDKCSKTLC